MKAALYYLTDNLERVCKLNAKSDESAGQA
jgi:hypothetical protein